MARKKEWSEGEMIVTFGLTKIIGSVTPLMQDWINIKPPIFSVVEQSNFNKIYQNGVQKIATWSEEDLKMKFISHVLDLGGVLDDNGFTSFFDKKLAGEVDGHSLSVKADFVVAKGVLNFMQRPFFHFQEYKPQQNPTGDPMAQLLEAFLIGQAENNDGKPLYGCEVIGKNWTFITMEKRTYCLSKSYDSTEESDLLQIISILRKFREILETRLLD